MMTGATRTAPEFDHIVIWQQNRFCRSLEETVECRDRLNANGVRVVSVTERGIGEWATNSTRSVTGGNQFPPPKC